MSLTTNKMFYVSWEAFHRATKELAKMCLAGEFDSIVAVSRGDEAVRGISFELITPAGVTVDDQRAK